ncbi:MAG TPA: tail fiber domain-containing protein [Flavobacteriaceae bacterium]|nr:tail fiber domain-containing protein [Flavobacteriaceae bacterium]
MRNINSKTVINLVILIFFVYNLSYAQVGIGTTNPTAQLTVNEDATFNESGGPNDFKVKSNDFDHMIYVDGALNRLGINNNSPLYPLHFKSFGTNDWQLNFENNNTTLGAVGLFHNTNASNGNRVLMGSTNYIGNSFEAPGVFGLSVNTTPTGRGAIGVLGAANNERGNAIEGALNFSGSYFGWGGYFNADLYCAGTFYGSDRRLKRDIEPITNAVDALNLLEPVSYFYDTERYPQIGLDENRKSFGFIAQDLELVFPEMVKDKLLVTNSNRKRDTNATAERETDMFKVVNYTLLIPVLTQAIKEQQTVIEEQNDRITALEDRLTQLESAMNQLVEENRN